MGIRTVMITGDNPLTAAAIAREAGVDDFLAQATPKDKMDLIKREQAEGKLVAMTGDGTNDAPALAQADVGVAMNTGTQAAKEAGNMVDLDSNPTKLIEVVEIGKQLLMTRGSLTTFSIANDVAKYFAIIPAMFAGTFPVLDALNIMRLKTPESAVLSAVIFNALIIVALIPLALRGVKYRPMGGGGAAAAEPVGLRRGRHYGAVPRDQAARHAHHPDRAGVGGTMKKNLITSVLMTLATTVLLGVIYPLVVTGLAKVMFPDRANGQLIARDGRIVGSRIIGQPFSGPGYFHGRPSAAGNGYDAANSNGSQLGPTNQKLIDRVQQDVASLQAENPGQPVPIDLVTTSASGLDPHLSPAAADFQIPRVARERGMSQEDLRNLVAKHTEGRQFGFLGEPRVNILELNLELDAIHPLGKLKS